MIRELTLESIPRVNKIIETPPTSDWHELKILTNHYQFLQSHRRLEKMIITGTALEQLRLPESVCGDEIIIPFDGLPPTLNDDEFTFFPQSGFPLETLLAYYQPIHLSIQYPLTWYQTPLPQTRRGQLPVGITRPHEFVSAHALGELDGKGTTICVHGIHDQSPPITHLGAQIHASFIAFPSVPVLWEPRISLLPYVTLHHRLYQIKESIKGSNPGIPNSETVTRQPLGLNSWAKSRETHGTFYRVGTMISSSAREHEWVRGIEIEGRVRLWLKREFSEERGHPEGFAESINGRLKFVHGGENEDPDDLVCQACGHQCRVPSV